MKHSGGGLLRRVLLRGSIVTWSSSEVLLEEASPAFVLGACSRGLSRMVRNLLLASSDRYVLYTGNSSHTSRFIFFGTSSM